MFFFRLTGVVSFIKSNKRKMRRENQNEPVGQSLHMTNFLNFSYFFFIQMKSKIRKEEREYKRREKQRQVRINNFDGISHSWNRSRQTHVWILWKIPILKALRPWVWMRVQCNIRIHSLLTRNIGQNIFRPSVVLILWYTPSNLSTSTWPKTDWGRLDGWLPRSFKGHQI